MLLRRARERLLASDGLTLIELVLAVALVGLLAAVAGPRQFFSATDTTRADLFSQELLSALRYAQKLAVATGCNVQVSLTATSYALTQQPGCAGAVYTLPVRDPGTGATAYANGAPSGVTISSTVNPIRFDALGRARDGAGAVSDAAIGVGARTLAVAGETGFVSAS
jgi:MSHA pilin protein MshC